VVLDLSGVHGTAVLERLRRHATAIVTMLCLVAISPAGRRALELAGFLAEFDHPDLATALCERP
jgi:anti-anti-sigma regulatory factor